MDERLGMRKLLLLIMAVVVSWQGQAKQTFTITGPEGHYLLPLAESILQELYQPLGIDISILQLPSARSLLYVNEGNADAELARVAGIDQQFAQLVPVEVPLLKLYLIAVARTDDISIERMQQARGGRVAIRLGTKYIEQYTAGWGVIQVDSIAQQLNLLVNKRVDYALIEGIKAELLLADISAEPLFQKTLETVPMFHYLHKKHQHLLPELANRMQYLRDSGRIDALIEQFLQRESSKML